MNEKERVHKLIAQRGYCSRRKAELLMQSGHVTVNGEVVKDLAFKASPQDTITVEGNRLSTVEKVTYVFYKPEGAVSTTLDEAGRVTVVDFIDDKRRLYPIGRLDYDTSGLLMLTNDGEFANRMMHPSSKIEKEYAVTIKGFLRKSTSEKFRRGVIIDGVKTQPAKIFAVKSNPKTEKTTAHVIITEGKHHQIKKMFQAFDHEVVKLKRVRFGTLTLEGLSKGSYRLLKPHEYKQLFVQSEKALNKS